MSKRMPAGSSLDGWMQQIWAQARLSRGLAHAAGALSAVVPALALANPSGGQVAAGSATIGTVGSNGVIVNQNSQRASINWQQFSIGANEYVQFVQPNSSSVVLNRVIGSNPSSIFGSIRANGQVFLINPNGILFAPGSTLDVSSLTASTLDISDADFMAGRYVFSRDPGSTAATVVNQGNVTVTPGGYVVLAGDYVENDGVISAQSGKVLLAAGGAATLTLDHGGGLISYKIDAPTLARLAGVDNAGSIVANGGAVVMTADVANALTATAVNNSGLITAHSVSQRGGEIMLLSEGGGIENSGTLDATANTNGVAGGTVILKGDGRTRLTDTSVIDTAGDGAKGGFVDVSGHELNLRGQVHAGKGGTLLLDPFFLHIVNGSSNITSASTDKVGVGWINQHLKSSDVVLQASNSIMNAGHAARTIQPASGSHNLTLEVNDGTIDIRGLTITMKGSLDIRAATGASGGSILMNGVTTAKAITLHGSVITVAGSLTATSGGITITGRASRDNHTPAFSISGAMHATGRVLVSYSNEGGVPTGYLNMKDVTGGTIKIVGEKISTGNLTATQSVTNALEVEASGSSVGTVTHNPASIHVTGNVVASHGGVFMAVHGGSGISVTGKVAAAFSHATLSASNLNGPAHVKVGTTVSAPEVNITAKSLNSASVSVGNVTATSFDVNVTATDTQTSGAQVAKIATGTLTAAKNVTLTAVGGNTGVEKITTGAITAYTSTCGLIDCNSGHVHITALQGSVDVTGAILVTHSKFDPGGVAISGHKITIGGDITADGVVDLLANGNLHAASISVDGAIHAGNGASLDAHGSYGGNVTVTGVIVSTNGNVTVKADNTRSASGGDISVGNVSANVVTIFSRGGGPATPLVKVGSITAASEASINVQFTGNTLPLLVETGAISAGDINILVKGHGAKFTAPSLKATGPSGATTAGYGSVAKGFITGLVSGSHHSASFNVAGTVKSLNGNISIIAGGGVNSPGGGAINTGNISAGRSIVLKGNDIQVGSVTAGSFVSMVGNSRSAVAHITATGLVKGSGVFVNANGSSTGYGAFGGSIDLQGGVTATGVPGGSVSAGEVGIHIVAKTTSTVKMDITTGALQAAGGSISVRQEGGRGGITINGAVTASSGKVDIQTQGVGSSSVGNISVGSISAPHGSADVFAVNPGGRGANITINGTVTARGIDMTASANTGGNITVTGGLTATNGGIFVDANSSTTPVGAGGNIHVSGATKASNGSVSFLAKGAGHSGGNITLGKVTAADGVSISGTFLGSAEAGSIKIQTGNITGEYVTITANGTIPVIKTGAIVATGTVVGRDYVRLLLNPTANASEGSINIGGLAKSSHGSISIDANGGAVTTAAITAVGSDGVVVSGGSINVTGAINASGGSAKLTADGVGGISIGGNVTALKLVQIETQEHGAGADIKVTGNITGSAVVVSASASTGADITVTGKITAKTGSVFLAANRSFGGKGSGGNITVGGTIRASNGSVSIDAFGGGGSGGNLNLANISAKTGMNIRAAYNTTSPGTASHITVQTGALAAEYVSISATGPAPIIKTGAITANGLTSSGSGGSKHDFIKLTLKPTSAGSGGGITVTGNINASHGAVSLSASHGVINLGNNAITAGGNVSINGGQVHLGSISAGGGISVTAVAVSGHAGSITAGATTLMTGKYVSIALTDSGGTKGNIAIGGVSATGTAGSSSHSRGGKVSIAANLPTKKVTVSTGALTAVGSVSVSVNDASGSATLGKLNAPTVHVSIANGNLTVGQLVHAGASLTASNGSITDTTTGSLNLVGDKFNTTHGVQLKAGTNITLTSDNFGTGGLSASAGGKLVETSSGILDLSAQVLKAKQLVLSAATIELGATKLTASSIQLSATSINNASGNGTITAAAGKIHATHGIVLVNENLVVSGAGPLISAASVDLDNAVVTGTGVLSVNATGNLDAIGLHVNAGGLTAHGGSVDLTGAKIAATKAVKISSVKDVNIGSAQIAGSAVGISAGRNVLNGSGTGALAAGAGALTIKAKGDVLLSSETLTIGAGGGSISATGNLEFADAVFGGAGTATLHAGKSISLTGAKMALGGVTMNAVGGSIDLTGLAADVTGQMTLQAKHDIILSLVDITAGTFIASASGNIHNGGGPGAITAAAIKVDAKKDINLSDTTITIGGGALTGVTGDTAMLQLLAAAGLKPASAAANGAFIAGGSLTLGTLDITGNYLVLQGSSISILGKVTAPTSGLLVEVRPVDSAQGIDVEGQSASGAAFDISNQAFLALFPGDTIVVGDDVEAGDVAIGINGPFTLAGGTNLLFDTTGTITGLGNILGTGLVGSLETVAGNAGNNTVVTAGEVDPSTTTTSLGDQTDKKHLGHSGFGQGNGEGQNGIIGTDTDTSSVCH